MHLSVIPVLDLAFITYVFVGVFPVVFSPLTVKHEMSVEILYAREFGSPIYAGGL